MELTTINRKWELWLPEHRANRGDWWDHWEERRLAHMEEFLDDANGHVLYLGAEQGDMPALVASWGNQVSLVEPTPWVWPNVKAIFDANGLATPLATFSGFAGVPDRNPESLVLDGWPDDADGEVSDVEGFTNLWERPDIPVISLNTFASTVPANVTHVSMDVEGAEFEVVAGACAVMLTEVRPLLWISVHPDFIPQYGHTADDLHSLLRAHGYEGELIADEHEQHWFYQPEEW